MLVTDHAMHDMGQEWSAWFARIAEIARRFWWSLDTSARPAQAFQADQHPPLLTLMSKPPTRPSVQVAGLQEMTMPAGGNDRPFPWRRHPQLRNRPATDPVDLAEGNRKARSLAVRGLFLARSGRLEEARAAFALAARNESIDLTAIPGFWSLSRGAMFAATAAYEDVERFRDASALAARIRKTYRPRAVAPISPRPSRKITASGN